MKTRIIHKMMNSSKVALMLAATIAASAALPLLARANSVASTRQHKTPRHARMFQGYVAAPQPVVVTGQEQKPSDNGYFVQSATADATGASESQTVNRATNDLN